jgi:hypothetical protein
MIRGARRAKLTAFSGETDLLLRNNKTGGLEVYEHQQQPTRRCIHRHRRLGLAIRGHRADSRG